MVADSPRFRHCWTCCIYQGQFGEYDVWYCSQNGRMTWMARYGNEGWDYSSYPEWSFDKAMFEDHGSLSPLAAILHFRDVDVDLRLDEGL